MGEETRVLNDVTNAPPKLRFWEASVRLPVDSDSARGGVDHPIDHPQRGRLPTPAGTNQHRCLPCWHLQGQIAHSDRAIRVAFRYVFKADGVQASHPIRGLGSVPGTTIPGWLLSALLDVPADARMVHPHPSLGVAGGPCTP